MNFTDQVNIFNGDSAAGVFKLAFKSTQANLLIYHDVISCGPIREFKNFKELQQLRESYWHQTVQYETQKLQRFVDMPCDFYSYFPINQTGQKYRLWLGTGLSDQLLMAFIVSVFERFDISIEQIEIVQFETASHKLDKRYRVQGLGLLSPDQIQNHPKPIKLSAEQAEYAKSAWQAYLSTDPHKYIKFMKLDHDALPLLNQAMSYLYDRYPNANNGLSQWDELILSQVSKGQTKAHQVIGEVMAATMSGLDYVGDLYLYSRLINLSNIDLPKPLLSRTPKNSSMRDTSVEITDFGQIVLNGETNAIKTNGINDWVGGVNINSAQNHVWVREDDQLNKL